MGEMATRLEPRGQFDRKHLLNIREALQNHAQTLCVIGDNLIATDTGACSWTLRQCIEALQGEQVRLDAMFRSEEIK